MTITIKKLAMIDIRLDGNTQSRAAVSDPTVGEYADAITEGAILPPIVVFHDGAAYYLADGFHRYLANKRIGAITMDAEVRTGALADAQLYAFGANQAHGLRRTNDDKRKAVLGVLALKSDWSDRAIAKHVGVGYTLVASARSSLPAAGSEKPAERTYTTKHGTKATMNTAGQTKAGAASRGNGKKDDGTTVATETASPVTPEQRAPSPAAAPKTEAEQIAEDAHGDTNLESLLAEVQQENRALQADVAAMQSDDQRAETLKWRRAYDAAVRGQSEAMDRAHKSVEREKATKRQLMRCGKAVGEDDEFKIAPAVEALARAFKTSKVAA